MIPIYLSMEDSTTMDHMHTCTLTSGKDVTEIVNGLEVTDDKTNHRNLLKGKTNIVLTLTTGKDTYPFDFRQASKHTGGENLL